MAVNQKIKEGLKPSVFLWCGREDLNLHESPRQILSLVRLPFSHARIIQNKNYYNLIKKLLQPEFIYFTGGKS